MPNQNVPGVMDQDSPIAATAKPEAIAKVALLNFLADQGRISSDVVVAAEVVLDGWRIRADLLLASDSLTIIEIKTKTDSLARLAAQLATYERASPFTYLAVATGHLKGTRSRIGKHIGLIELRRTQHKLVPILIREAKRSPKLVSDGVAALLGTREIERLIRSQGTKVPSKTTRSQLLKMASNIDVDIVVSHTLAHLIQRYSASSSALWSAAGNSAFDLPHLEMLKAWAAPTAKAELEAEDLDRAFFRWLETSAEWPLGEPPEDVKRLLSA